MERIIKGLCEAADATFTFDYTRGHPPVINDALFGATCTGNSATCTQCKSRSNHGCNMVGEDFSYYLNARPGVFFFTGKAFRWPSLMHIIILNLI